MNPDLHLCNLVAQGVPMAKAKKIVAQSQTKSSGAPIVAEVEPSITPVDGGSGAEAPAGAPVDPGEKPAWMP